MHVQNNGSPHTPQQQHNGGQFGILTAGPIQHNSIGRLQQEEDIFGTPEGSDQKSNGHLSTKIVVDPPNLAEWRQKLFNVDEMITLSQEEYVVPNSRRKTAELMCIALRRTSHTWIMFTLTAPPNVTSGSRSFLTTGTVDSRADLLEHQSRMTRIRKRGSGLLESGIFAMSRSRSPNTSQVLCYEPILCQMEANRQTQHRAITTSLQDNQESRECTNNSLVCH